MTESQMTCLPLASLCVSTDIIRDSQYRTCRKVKFKRFELHHLNLMFDNVDRYMYIGVYIYVCTNI